MESLFGNPVSSLINNQPQTPTHLLNTQNQNTQPFAQAIINSAAQFIQPSLPSLSQNLTIKLEQDNYLL